MQFRSGGGARPALDQEGSQSLLHTVLAATAEGIMFVGRDGQILTHNQRFLEIWGLDDEVLHRGSAALLDIVRDRLIDPDAFGARVREIYADPAATSVDFLQFRDGRIIQRFSQPHREEGSIVGRIWAFRDITEQRHTEAALAESERRFRRMAANVPGVIFQFYVKSDGTLRYTYLSDGCATLLGVQPASFPWDGRELLERIHPEDLGSLSSAVADSAASMEPWTWEGRVVLDGGTRWMRAASRPTRAADGKLSWDGLLMDVTEEKTAVAALHSRELQLAEAQRVAHIGSWESDFVSGRSVLSTELWRIFGLPENSLPWSYARFVELVHPADREMAMEAVAAALRQGGDFEYGCRIVRADGSERYVEVRGHIHLNPDRTPLRILGTIQDVTERRLTEERSRHLFDHAADAFFLHDAQGRILAVNPHACESLGYTEEELMGLNLAEVVAGATAEELTAQWERLAPGTALTIASTHVRKDGSVFPTEVRTGPFADGSDERLIISIARDVTEQRKAAAALEKRVKIEQALTRVSRILAAPSADIELVLRLLAEAIGADRAYLFRSRTAGVATLMDCTHEWRAVGVAPAIQNLQGIDIVRAPWWVERLGNAPCLVVQDLAELPPQAAFERSLLEMHGVKATAAVPVTDIRNGLLGFLGFDYVTTQRTWSDDDVRVLQTAGEMLVSHFARQLAEREILQRDRILEAASFMAERFLRATDWEGGIDQALALIGAAAGVSRAYLFQTWPGENGEILVGQRAEWVADGIEPMLPHREFSRASLPSLGLARWDELFRANQPVQGVVSTLPEYEAMCLGAQGIKSILQIPVFVGDRWWGTLGFDDCLVEREWSTAEWEVLGTTGRMIAAAVQRTRAEEALGESEDRFRQMAESIREVFFMVSARTHELIYLSPAYEEVWGRDRRDVDSFIASILPEDLPLVLADMELSRTGAGDPHRFVDYRIVRPDGTIRWIRHRIFQIFDEEGRPDRVTGVCTDITEQKQMEEELRRANRIEAIGHLAAGIAHEINTPIQYIGDNVRFLDESYADLRTALEAYRALAQEAAAGPIPPGRVAEIVAIVDRCDVHYVLDEAPRASAQALDGVQRVAEIVRAMKEFSHPGATEKVPTDLNQAIRSTTTVARNEWKYVAELVTELDPDIPLVACVPGELNQAILNLVVNAAHAIAERQAAEGSDRPGAITVSTSSGGGFVQIRVADTGTGIREEIRQRIFDPFFTTKEVGRGTGQGLTFVHSIVVEKHGGTVAFETEVGSGTTFTVRLPHRPDGGGLSEAA